MRPREWSTPGGCEARVRKDGRRWLLEVDNPSGARLHESSWASEMEACGALMCLVPELRWEERRPPGAAALTVAQAAAEVGLSAQALYDEHEAGRIEFFRMRAYSKGYRVRRAELERWAAENLVAC